MATNMQLGGWYNNPAQGGKNMRYWGGDSWTMGEDPTGGRGANWQQTSPTQTNQSTTQDMNSYFDQQNKLSQQAIAPAIESLKAQIPNIQKSYATQISQKQADIAPLNERYTSLINQIKGQGQTSVNKQTSVTAGELGKRGIEGSSTLAGQEIASATLPIEQQTQSLTQQTGLAQSADVKAIQDAIANLYNQQNVDVGNVSTNMANLQSGAGQTAVTNALAQYNAAQTAKASANAPVKQEVQTIGGSKYLVNPYTGAKTYLGAAESSGGGDISSLLSQLTGTTGTESKPTGTPTTQTSQVPDYATPVQKSTVLGQTVTGLGPQDVLTNAPKKDTTNWWDKLFGNNYASSQVKL